MDVVREVIGVCFAVFVAVVLLFGAFCIAVSFIGGDRHDRSDPAGPGWTSGDTEAETEADPADDEAARRAARQAAQEAEAG
jgi:hypothetical protein